MKRKRTDGSYLGVSPGRALRTMLGGQSQPPLDDCNSPENVLKRVIAAPLPGQGLAPYHQSTLSEEEQYGLATDCIAHAMLETTDIANEASGCDEAWNRAKKEWPQLGDWLQGPTGFMVGFAWNSVRYIKGWDEQSNPAILTLEGETDEPNN